MSGVFNWNFEITLIDGKFNWAHERKRSAIKGGFVLLFMQKINTFVE